MLIVVPLNGRQYYSKLYDCIMSQLCRTIGYAIKLESIIFPIHFIVCHLDHFQIYKKFSKKIWTANTNLKYSCTLQYNLKRLFQNQVKEKKIYCQENLQKIVYKNHTFRILAQQHTWIISKGVEKHNILQSFHNCPIHPSIGPSSPRVITSIKLKTFKRIFFLWIDDKGK